jgi:hypothetical protein
MSTITSTGGFAPASAAPLLPRLATASELLLFFAGILLYIWRWQYTYPWICILLFAGMLLTHVLHGDTARELGLTITNLGANARIALPLALPLYLPLVAYGFARHALVLGVAPTRHALGWFAGYGMWCTFQQYLMQSYFHNRLMSVIEKRHLTSLLVAIMFGGTHIPNPILIVATTAGGFMLAEIFAHHRNIWPLALAQTVGGILIAAVSPAALIHNMRVGPGYFFYGIR